MRRLPVALTVPQPCAESWDAMTPTATGRHCAACQKTVVDFTLKTDAEILAMLATAAGGRTCGRFAAGQLGRPLQRAAPVAPTARWRAWLAAAVAVWAVREGVGTAATAQTATEWRARYWGGPAPAAPANAPQATTTGEVAPATHSGESKQLVMGAPLAPAARQETVLRGVVRDAATHEELPGVTVLLKGTSVGTSTGLDGSFELPLSIGASAGKATVVFSTIGYLTREQEVAPAHAPLVLNMTMDTQVLGGLEITGSYRKPWPWHPRALFNWGKYWLTRPFRR
jgi:hypothetical protein